MKVTPKLRVILNDSVWSIAALVLMNMAAQFAVYPFWAKQFGAETYGDILYLLSYINILAVSGGSALNYARMASSAQGETCNGEYNLIMLILCVVAVPFSFLVRQVSGVEIKMGELWIFWVLLCTTMLRNYMDVDFRLSLNYKGYFWYYAWISIGYGLGIFLCHITNIWELALLPGEIFGIGYVLLRGENLRKRLFQFSPLAKAGVRLCLIMLATNGIVNIIFNADRLMLKAMIGGAAVTIYYLSSLMGKTISLITTPLNSVIISYLARYDGAFTKKMFWKVLVILALAALVLVFGCVIGSHVLIRLLYAENYEMTREFFWVASVSQVVYFATSVLMVVLLRFAKQMYQLYINLAFAAAFICFGIPMTTHMGLWGFSYAILIANVIRMIVSVWLGVRDQKRRQREGAALQSVD